MPDEPSKASSRSNNTSQSRGLNSEIPDSANPANSITSDPVSVERPRRASYLHTLAPRAVFAGSKSNNVRGALILLVAAGFFSAMAAIIKLAGEHLHVTQILLLRQTGMLLIMSPKLLKDPVGSYKTKRLDLQLCRLCLALIAMICGFSAVIHMPLPDATALGFAKSFFVTIFAVLILRETVGIYRWGAVAAGFVGVLIMLQPGSSEFSVYSVMAIIGAAAAGAVMVIIRLLSRTESTHTIMSYQATGVALVMFIPALITWQSMTPYLWFLVVILAVTSYVGQRLNVVAYTLGEASMLASLDYTRLIYAVILGFFLFDQLPGMSTMAGAVIIVAAAVFTVQRESRRKKVLAQTTEGPDKFNDNS